MVVRFNGKEQEWTRKQLERFWKEELVASMRVASPSFVVDESNKRLLSALYDWVMGIKGVLDTHKGLLLYGDLGVGKSTLLKGLQHYCAKINQYCYGFSNDSVTFHLVSAAEISLRYSEKGIEGITQYIERDCMRNLAIDEVGREPMDSKHYGTGINVIQTVLQLRYEQRYNYLTHLTTNLDPDKEFAQYYDSYIADRVKEMFNVIKIEGKSRR